jgi:hypothetical protein
VVEHQRQLLISSSVVDAASGRLLTISFRLGVRMNQ